MSIEQVVVNSAEQEEDAAYLAEMAIPVLEDDVNTPEAETVQPEAEVAAEPVVERKEVFDGYTAEELKAALEMLPKMQKAIDTTNGTMGSRLADQQRALEQLQQRQSVGTLSPEKLTRLSKEFPEIAEMLASDLNDVMSHGMQGTRSDETVTAKMQEMENRITQKEQALEVRALNREHKDWKEVASYETQNGQIAWKNPAFGQWVGKQPNDVQDQIMNAWDADFLSSKLTEFKESIKPKSVKNKQVLEDAVLPRGSSNRTSGSDLDEEEKAFRAEMAKS